MRMIKKIGLKCLAWQLVSWAKIDERAWVADGTRVGEFVVV